MGVMDQIDPFGLDEDFVGDRIGSVADHRFKRGGSVFHQEVKRIKAFWQGQNSQIDIVGDEQVEDFIGSFLSGFIAVEDECDPVGESLDQADVLVIERQAECRRHHDGRSLMAEAPTQYGIDYRREEREAMTTRKT